MPPGAAHRSSTRMPGSGASSSAALIAARDCATSAPALHSGSPRGSNGASTTSPSGISPPPRTAGPARVATPRSASSAATAAGSATSVLTRSALSAGSFTLASSARASSGPSASHHSSAIQSGTEWSTRRLVRRRVAERGEQPRSLAPGAPQDRVDELEGRAAAAFASSTLWSTAACGATPSRNSSCSTPSRSASRTGWSSWSTGRPAQAAITWSSVRRRCTPP